MALVTVGSSSGGAVFTSAKKLVAGTAVSPGTGVCISALAPGPVTLIMADGTQMTVFAVLGTTMLPGISAQGVVGGAESYATVYGLS